MNELLSQLMCLALSDPEDSDGGRSLLASGSKATDVWLATQREARLHRLEALLAYTLRRHDLELPVLEQARSALKDAYPQTLVANSVLLQVLRDLLPALAKAGVSPILFKGIVLADAYYPDLGTRPMEDVDMLIQPGESEAVAAAFAELGFAQSGEWGSSGAVNFHNALGLCFDVHERFLLFPLDMRAEITEELEMPGLGGRRVRSWEPNALLVHLLVHLAEHRKKTGFVLGWLLDLAFVVQRRGAELELERLAGLMPDRDGLLLLWRVLGFLQSDCGLVLPAALVAPVGAQRPLRLAGILRDRRLALWGLPGLRGWMRLLACRLGRRKLQEGGYPRMSDLLLGLLPAGRS